METPEYLKEHFDSLSIDYFKFIFEQSEKFLSRLVTIAESVTKKAHQILVISVSVFTLSIGATFTLADPKLVFSSALLSLLSAGTILLLIKPLVSYSFSVPGSMPSKLLDKDFVVNFSNQDNIVKNLILNEILDYQTRIDQNTIANRERIVYVDRAMFLLVLSPFVSWVIGLICG